MNRQRHLAATANDDDDDDESRRRLGTNNIFIHTTTTETNTNADQHLYADAQSGDNSNNGSTKSNAVKTLSRVLNLVKNQSPPSSNGNLIVHLSGSFDSQRLVLNDNHSGASKTRRVIFRGEDDGSTKLRGGEELEFVKVSSLPTNHPARQLAALSNAPNLSNIYAAPPPSNFPNSNKDSSLRFPDGDCRDFENYASPPTLSIGGNQILTRSREPNLPPPTTTTAQEDSMGEVRDTWLRTTSSNNQGRIQYATNDKPSVDLASDASWNSGSVMVHLFPLVDWYDARVQVGPRRSASSYFETITNQKSPGDPCETGNKFKITNGARYYLEGAVEYLDEEGEYHVSLGEVISGSRGWTLMIPPAGIDPTDGVFDAVLSLTTQPVIKVEGSNMFVSFEHLHVEASRRYLTVVSANDIDFYSCTFLNAGHDAIEAYGQRITIRNSIVEGSGGSSIQLSDDRDFESDGKGFLLLESGNAVVDTLLSDFASTCRHYSEGIHLGGYGTLVSNNHFRSSNMAAIDVVGGGFRMLHNVFSHVSDGSYDDGAIHWVAESAMERGTEVGYNVFFRNGVSTEPCNAETSCYQSDVYMDDMAGAMSIHGNVMIKDKVIQTAPPSNKFAVINWVSIFINGGADIAVYENAFLGPKDGTANGAIYKDKGVFFEETCGGTIYPDGTSCGHTGICSSDPWYATMVKYKWKQNPWKSAFPELLNYELPDQGSNWRCAARRSCPMASWNITVLCNGGVGSNRVMSNRAVWPSDPFSSLKDSAVEGKTVPKRIDALTERGNKPGTASFNEDVVDINAIENAGIDAVLALAQRVAFDAQAEGPNCEEGSRNGAARSQLAGRGNNPCTESWSFDGMASCDPCIGSIICAPRDLPGDRQCSCGGPPPPTPPTLQPVNNPTPTPPPVDNPTSNTPEPTPSEEGTPEPTPGASSLEPTPEPTAEPTPTPVCKDDNKRKFFKNKKMRKCGWLASRKNKKLIRSLCRKKAKFCEKTCGTCDDDETPAPTPGPANAYKIIRNKGYCESGTDKEISGKISDPATCWKKCKNKHKFSYAELNNKVCYCQKTCSCMSSSDDAIAIVPSGFSVPGQCR